MTNSLSYGATGARTNGSTHGQHAGHHSNCNEEDALLPSNNKKPPKSSLRPYWTGPLAKPHADLILLLCYVCTGLLDSSSTLLWGAFVSMQTGNSIYLGLGLVDPVSSDRCIKSAVSIVCFCLGSFLFSRFHRILSGSPKRRWVMVTSYAVQTLMIIAAAVVVRLTPRPEPGDEHDLHWHVLVPLGLMAAQSAGQTVTSRALEWNALTSTVLTSVYCDLWSDQKLFTGLTDNVQRNQRLVAPVLLIVGAMGGGLWNRTEFGVDGALWTAAGLKLGIAVTWALWKEEKSGEEDR